MDKNWDNNEFMQEKMDLKRFSICLLNKIWVIIVATVIGAFLGSGLCLFMEVVFEKEAEFVQEADYYLEFAFDESGAVYQAFNGYTWDDLLSTDPIMGYAMTLLPEGMTKEYVDHVVSATIPADIRDLKITVVTNNREEAEQIGRAMEQALIHYGEVQREFSEIRMIEFKDPVQKLEESQWKRAGVAGMLVFFLISVAGIVLAYILDDSIYTQEELEERFSLKGLGTYCKSNKKDSYRTNWDKELKLNLDYISGGEKIALISFEKKTDEIKALTDLIQKDSKVFSLGEMTVEDYLELRSMQNRVIIITWAGKNGRKCKHVLSLLQKQDCAPVGGILLGASPKFLRMYYGKKNR